MPSDPSERAPHAPAWWRQGLRPLLPNPERSLISFVAGGGLGGSLQAGPKMAIFFACRAPGSAARVHAEGGARRVRQQPPDAALREARLEGQPRCAPPIRAAACPRPPAASVRRVTAAVLAAPTAAHRRPPPPTAAHRALPAHPPLTAAAARARGADMSLETKYGHYDEAFAASDALIAELNAKVGAPRPCRACRGRWGAVRSDLSAASSRGDCRWASWTR